MLRYALALAVLFGSGPCGSTRYETETDFVVDTASRTSLELRLADQAVSHATSDAVRELAKSTIADKRRTHRELEGAAAAIDFRVPDGLTEEHRDEFIRLAGLRGASFDQGYAEALVRQREEAVAEFSAESARSGTEVAKWAARMLPQLETELAQARALAAQTGGIAAAERQY